MPSYEVALTLVDGPSGGAICPLDFFTQSQFVCPVSQQLGGVSAGQEAKIEPSIRQKSSQKRKIKPSARSCFCIPAPAALILFRNMVKPQQSGAPLTNQQFQSGSVRFSQVQSGIVEPHCATYAGLCTTMGLNPSSSSRPSSSSPIRLFLVAHPSVKAFPGCTISLPQSLPPAG